VQYSLWVHLYNRNRLAFTIGTWNGKNMGRQSADGKATEASGYEQHDKTHMKRRTAIQNISNTPTAQFLLIAAQSSEILNELRRCSPLNANAISSPAGPPSLPLCQPQTNRDPDLNNNALSRRISPHHLHIPSATPNPGSKPKRGLREAPTRPICNRGPSAIQAPQSTPTRPQAMDDPEAKARHPFCVHGLWFLRLTDVNWTGIHSFM
jgi:hypothetical protein